MRHKENRLFTFIRVVLSFCCGFLFTSPIDAKEQGVSLKVEGDVTDYQWAHSANKLAILLQTADENAWLYILDADTGELAEKIAFPTQEHIATFGWLSDDGGVLLATFDNEDGSGNFYTYRFAEKAFIKVYEKVERIYAQATSIVMDQGSSYWAATYVGEGHPDVAIYQDETLLLTTDVYPSFIAAARWKDHQLYCVSGAYLEFGLTREQRDQHPQFGEDKLLGRDDAVVYALDPLTQQARLANISPEVLFDASYDNTYELTIDQGEQSFVITLH